MKALLVVVAVLLAACSSTSSSGPDCDDISGNWRITSVRTDGDCDRAKFNGGDENITLRKGANGQWIAILPGLAGNCPGDLNPKTCRFIANCDFSSGGSKVGSIGADWTFDGPHFSGSEIGRQVIAPTCTANYSDSGSKL